MSPRFSFVLVPVVCICIAITSCKKEGCTDSFANNYDANARKDDGSCVYRGCTDEGALNYSYLAREDDGSCQYPGSARFYSQIPPSYNTRGPVITEIFMGNSYIGDLQSNCSENDIGCSTTCNKLAIDDLSPGQYSASYVRYQILTNENENRYNDTLMNSDPHPFTIAADECSVLILKLLGLPVRARFYPLIFTMRFPEIEYFPDFTWNSKIGNYLWFIKKL